MRVVSKRHQCQAMPSLATIISKDMFILTCKAMFKLGLACSAIVLLMKSGRLPAATPSVLSKVAFNVTIPCTLLVKSAETLATSQGDTRYLMVSVTAMLQVRRDLFSHARPEQPVLACPTRAKKVDDQA